MPRRPSPSRNQPLRVFLSSRMQELSHDRALLIETISETGHWPRFIENEPHNKETIKGPIESLIDDSDAFVLVTYLTAGTKISMFENLTPIEYELKRFLKKDKPGRVLWLQRGLPRGLVYDMPKPPFATLERTIKGVKPGRLTIKSYTDPLHARQALAKWLKALPSTVYVPLPRYIIRCTTTDCVGQINCITKFLVERRFNIDYIDQAAKAGKATIYITASQRADECLNAKDKAACEEFQNELKFAILKHMTEERGLAVGGSEAYVEIHDDSSPYSTPQLALDLRAMDVPGQLFSITRIIARKDLNIDRIDAQPAGPDHKNQLRLRLLVSGRPLRTPTGALQVLRDLEVELGRLIGVRSLTARFLEEVKE